MLNIERIYSEKSRKIELTTIIGAHIATTALALLLTAIERVLLDIETATI